MVFLEERGRALVGRFSSHATPLYLSYPAPLITISPFLRFATSYGRSWSTPFHSSGAARREKGTKRGAEASRVKGFGPSET